MPKKIDSLGFSLVEIVAATAIIVTTALVAATFVGNQSTILEKISTRGACYDYIQTVKAKLNTTSSRVNSISITGQHTVLTGAAPNLTAGAGGFSDMVTSAHRLPNTAPFRLWEGDTSTDPDYNPLKIRNALTLGGAIATLTAIYNSNNANGGFCKDGSGNAGGTYEGIRYDAHGSSSDWTTERRELLPQVFAGMSNVQPKIRIQFQQLFASAGAPFTCPDNLIVAPLAATDRNMTTESPGVGGQFDLHDNVQYGSLRVQVTVDYETPGGDAAKCSSALYYSFAPDSESPNFVPVDPSLATSNYRTGNSDRDYVYHFDYDNNSGTPFFDTLPTAGNTFATEDEWFLPAINGTDWSASTKALPDPTTYATYTMAAGNYTFQAFGDSDWDQYKDTVTSDTSGGFDITAPDGTLTNNSHPIKATPFRHNTGGTCDIAPATERNFRARIRFDKNLVEPGSVLVCADTSRMIVKTAVCTDSSGSPIQLDGSVGNPAVQGDWDSARRMPVATDMNFNPADSSVFPEPIPLGTTLSPLTGNRPSSVTGEELGTPLHGDIRAPGRMVWDAQYLVRNPLVDPDADPTTGFIEATLSEGTPFVNWWTIPITDNMLDFTKVPQKTVWEALGDVDSDADITKDDDAAFPYGHHGVDEVYTGMTIQDTYMQWVPCEAVTVCGKAPTSALSWSNHDDSNAATDLWVLDMDYEGLPEGCSAQVQWAFVDPAGNFSVRNSITKIIRVAGCGDYCENTAGRHGSTYFGGYGFGYFGGAADYFFPGGRYSCDAACP